MIAGSIRKQELRKQEPIKYLSVILAALALLAIGAAGGAVAAVAASQPTVTYQTLPAPVPNDHLQQSGPR
jgi:hypothetical protein